MATLPGTWYYRVSAGTGWPSLSILWLGEVESLICNSYLSVAAVGEIASLICNFYLSVAAVGGIASLICNTSISVWQQWVR